jgi:hypothetical protein
MRDPKHSSQAFFIAMVGAASAILAAILFGAQGCSRAPAQGTADPYDMKCQDVDGTSGLLQRCYNTEVICYVDNRASAGLSCIPKQGE